MEKVIKKENAKERLLKFLLHLDIGQGKFEELVGISNGYINNNKGSIGSSVMDRISTRYPELNINWIATGNGDMLISSKEKHLNNSNESYYREKYIESLQNIISEKEETIKLQKDEIMKLKDEISRLNGIISKSSVREEKKEAS
ncbi:MAG TPA: hypothetical protein GXX42_10605 [Petrimonas sp.]|uniref:hypothetical protein n=1 Tax=Petrimonas sp. TaxID=2023866 RepID=UPI001770FFA0|nr:hypothetical protein [Petrimonas sp.]